MNFHIFSFNETNLGVFMNSGEEELYYVLQNRKDVIWGALIRSY